MRFLAGFFVGLLWSNWIEYAYHRWAMHWPSLYQPAAMRHALHHSAPSNPQHITMKFGFWTAIFITNILLFAVPDQLLHLRILTGVTAAFLAYIVVGVEVHLRIHDGRWVPDAWKAHHLSHHVRPQKNFNIFLPIFDWLLGSKNMSLLMYERRSVVDGIKEDTDSGTNQESIGALESAKRLDEFIR